MKINKDEIKEFVKTIRNAHNIISYNNGPTFESRKMNEYLLEAANIIENLEKEILELKGEA